jgi:hypothetical protein
MAAGFCGGKGRGCNYGRLQELLPPPIRKANSHTHTRQYWTSCWRDEGSMPRLIDDIRLRGAQMPVWVERDKEGLWAEYARRVLELLSNRELPVLLIDNVADYYYRGTGQEYWDLERDFPNLAPPFPAFWCEHKLTHTIHSDEKGDTDVSAWLGKDARMGVLVMALDPAHQKGEGIPENAKWILWMDVFIDYDHTHNAHANGPHGAIFMVIDAEGRLIGRPWMQSYAPTSDADVMRSFMTWLYPTFLAVSFLHCKNVKIEDNTVPKPLAKKQHARTGQWPAPYRTLIIEPLKQILRREGKSDQHGLAKALHICRGHFRDYREGRGLFGRYHALVWTPMTVRGTKGKAAPAREIEVKI